MLHSAQAVKDAMSLSRDALKAISIASGYGCEGFLRAEFEGMNESGTFVYDVEYIDSVNGNGNCSVFIRILPNIGCGPKYSLEF